ncbi:hypothetical protein LSM04_008101 [Trypanosoma melophagium]|uniref:uncharacterized protein n=1 Tax=Trypanosoma melophagium TaxID=715481 RepID=UPI00351A5BB6|nr:hypothetical protein LSM04_008101 [Trypanosoma melophagium]
MRRVLHSACITNGLITSVCLTAATPPLGTSSNSSSNSPFTKCHSAAILLSTRAQGSFGGGRGRGSGGRGRGGRDNNNNNNNNNNRGGSGKPSGGSTIPRLINQTGDGELSDVTRIMMRDDWKILTSIVKHIPQNGAISIKSLNAQLLPDVQEAISEKHDGLKIFLEKRKQLFIVKANPADGVLYVAATPLAYQKLIAREKQRETMQEMLGLNRRGGRGGGRGGNRGGRGNRGRGRGGNSYSNNSDGGGGGGRFGGGGDRFRGRGGNNNNNGGRMGGEARSFGRQSRH